MHVLSTSGPDAAASNADIRATGDMKQPVCGLCQRVGTQCTFALRRKPRQRRKPQERSKPTTSPSSSENQDLSSSLETASLLLPQGQVPMVDNRSEAWDLDLSLATEPWMSLVADLAHGSTSSEQPNDNENGIGGGGGGDGGGWGVPSEVIRDLIDLFFENTKSWLTFVHRSNFDQRFTWSVAETCQMVERSAVSDSEAFMIYCMFAIAARFSSSAHFKQMPILDRGEAYADRAVSIKDFIMKDISEPSLDFLKGCVILAFYYLSAGQIGPGSVLTSVCVRFAYDLSLDEVDRNQMRDDGSLISEMLDENPNSWLKKEELRRLWWSIWELDTFVSTLSLQPYSIEKESIKVLLPVSDFNWRAGIPMTSAFIDQRPESLWKSLQGSPNQSARAWFLMANYLKSDIVLAARQKSPTNTRERLEAALCSFKLSLPSNFQLRSLFLDGHGHEEGSWIIATHLIIIASETILERSTWAPRDRSEVESCVGFPKRVASYLVQIGQVWTPEYIPLCHPIICCAVIAPCSTGDDGSDFAVRAHEVAKLVLGHYAKYWKLGSEMLRLLSIIEQGLPSNDTFSNSTEQWVTLKQYAALLPSMSRRRRVRNAYPEPAEDSGCNANHSTPALDSFLDYCNVQSPGENLSAFGDFELEQALENQSTVHKMSHESTRLF